MTFKQSSLIIEKIAKAFISLGLSERSCIALLSYNRVEWNMCFWGAVISNNVAFGIYMTNSPAECLHILNDSKAPIIFLEDQIQYDKIIKIKEQLKYLKYVVTMENVK